MRVLAQQSKKIYRIGYLSATSASSQTTLLDSFRQGLHALGYTEGKDFEILDRYAGGKPENLEVLSVELLRLNPDVVLTGGPAATRAARTATSSIPIVMSYDTDPVGNGFIASFGAAPGGNVTGLSSLAPDISVKELELLRDAIPKLAKVAVLGDPSHPGDTQALADLRKVAPAFRLQVQFFDLREPANAEIQFGGAGAATTVGIIALTGPILTLRRRQIVESALRKRVPLIHSWPDYVQEGALMAYGANYADMYRRAATYVDKILKGAKPADLPVEQPTKFELIVNMKTAKTLGIKIPNSILVRADKVIE